MTAFRLKGARGGVMDDIIYPGDLVISGETLGGTIVTVGAGTLSGAAIATGLIIRSGSVAGYIDTLDTATNVLNALLGNASGADLVVGNTFRLRIINTVAFLETLAAGVGFTLDTTSVPNAVTTIAASSYKDFLVTILNTTPQQVVSCNTTNANAVVTFVLPPGRTSLLIGPNSTFNITPGMVISGTGITAGTTVIGITLGQGGVVGFTMSANATATSAVGGVALTFGPTMKLTPISGSVAITA